MIRNLPIDPLHERVGSHHLLPCPGRNLTDKDLERPQVNPRLDPTLGIDLYTRLIKLSIPTQRRGGATTIGAGRLLSLGRADGREVMVVNDPNGIFIEPPDVLEVPHSGPFRKLFNLVRDDGS